jgi:diadenosine tetraphosphate (Ap4A) HIT family hydrolase
VAKEPFDAESYAERVQDGPCFVCAMLEGHPDYPGHRFYEDEDTVAFLARYPTLLGHALVAPKRHAEMLVEDLNLKEYVRLQRVVYRVAKAISAVLPTERVYVLSLGRKDAADAHVHWHVAPVPPGAGYDERQHHALVTGSPAIDVTEPDQVALALALRHEIGRAD